MNKTDPPPQTAAEAQRGRMAGGLCPICGRVPQIHASTAAESFLRVDCELTQAEVNRRLREWRVEFELPQIPPRQDTRYEFTVPVPGPNGTFFTSGVAFHYERPPIDRWWFRLTEPTERDPGLSVCFMSDQLATRIGRAL